MKTSQISVRSQAVDHIDNLEEKVKYLLIFGKFIGIYPLGSSLDRYGAMQDINLRQSFLPIYGGFFAEISLKLFCFTGSLVLFH